MLHSPPALPSKANPITWTPSHTIRLVLCAKCCRDSRWMDVMAKRALCSRQRGRNLRQQIDRVFNVDLYRQTCEDGHVVWFCEYRRRWLETPTPPFRSNIKNVCHHFTPTPTRLQKSATQYTLFCAWSFGFNVICLGDAKSCKRNVSSTVTRALINAKQYAM